MKLSPTAKREQRRTCVASLLLAGKSFRQISKEIGASPATICRDAKTILKRWRDESLETVDDYVCQDLRRVDLALGSIHDRVQDGELAAIDRWVRLLDHRSKLLGLYEPSRVQAEIQVSYLEQAREEAEVIAEYEVIKHAAKQIVEQRDYRASDPPTSVAVEALGLGAGSHSA